MYGDQQVFELSQAIAKTKPLKATTHSKTGKLNCIKKKKEKLQICICRSKEAENSARLARSEPPLPDEDLNKIFKPMQPLSRIEPLLISNQIKNYCEQINEFTAQSFSNLFIADAVQNK